MWLSYLHHASKLQFHFFPRSIALNFVIDLLSWICFFFLYKQSDFTLEKCQDFWRRISWEHHHMQWEINKRSLTGLLRTFLLLCYSDWFKIVVPLSQPIRSEVKSKRTIPQSHAFSCAWPPLWLYLSRSDCALVYLHLWLVTVDDFGFWFTLNKNCLKAKPGRA